MPLLSPETEDEVLKVLKCLVEEWGPDRIKIFLPAEWYDPKNGSYVGQVRAEYSTVDEIILHVGYDQGEINYRVKCDGQPKTNESSI